MVAKEQSQPQIRGRVKRTDSNEAPQMFFAALLFHLPWRLFQSEAQMLSPMSE